MIYAKQFNMERLLNHLLDENHSRDRDMAWRWSATIVEEYLPPHPRPETRPECHVQFGDSELRYSRGPGQGFFWDMYGDDFFSPELALVALLNAPVPYNLLKFDKLTKESEADRIQRNKELMLEDFAKVFEKAGYPKPFNYTEIPNEYCGPTGCEICASHPWLLVGTPFGPLKVGWRKRVISIDWTATAIKTKAEKLFHLEDTTKWDHGIHAWGYGDMQQYLAKLLIEDQDPKAIYKPDKVYGRTRTSDKPTD